MRQAPASKTRSHVTALASERSKAAWPARTANGWPATISSRSFAASARSRCRARAISCCRSSSRPAHATADRRPRSPTRDRTPTARSTRARTCRRLSFSDNGDANGPVVFAGYGIVVPEAQNFGYDSYATLDVKDKIVLVLRYFPEDADSRRKASSRATRTCATRRWPRASAARRRCSSSPVRTSPNAGETVPMTFDTALAGSGIVAASISGAVADAMFATLGDPGKTLSAAQKALDAANPHVAGFAMPERDRERAHERRAREAHRPQRRRLPAGDRSRRRCREAVGRARRALRSSRPRRERQLARRQGRRRSHSLRRRRQRVGFGGRARGRRSARLAAPPSQHRAGVLVGRGARPDRLDGVREQAAGSARSARGVSELRHGRPHAGQQAHRAGDRHEPGLGDGCSSRRTSRPDSTC